MNASRSALGTTLALALLAIVVAIFIFWQSSNVDTGALGEEVAQQEAVTEVPTRVTLASPTSTPSLPLATDPEDILGDWRGVNSLMFFRYMPDGTYRGARDLSDLEDQPLFAGEFRFEGTQLFIFQTEAAGAPNECPSTPGIYEVQLLDDGNLRYKMIEDECEPRFEGLPGLHRPID